MDGAGTVRWACGIFCEAMRAGVVEDDWCLDANLRQHEPQTSPDYSDAQKGSMSAPDTVVHRERLSWWWIFESAPPRI